MRIELNDQDVQTLATALRAYLPDLRREVSRTDDRNLRHQLAERQETCERLLAQLEIAVIGTRS